MKKFILLLLLLCLGASNVKALSLKKISKENPKVTSFILGSLCGATFIASSLLYGIYANNDRLDLSLELLGLMGIIAGAALTLRNYYNKNTKSVIPKVLMSGGIGLFIWGILAKLSHNWLPRNPDVIINLSPQTFAKLMSE